MLEPMGAFFEKRLDGYDRHMMTNIASAEEFYPFTARCLPAGEGCKVLDLGCGTGLELEAYFAVNPTADTAIQIIRNRVINFFILSKTLRSSSFL